MKILTTFSKILIGLPFCNEDLESSNLWIVYFLHITSFDILKAVLLKTRVFGDVRPSRLVNSYRRFEATYCLYQQNEALEEEY